MTTFQELGIPFPLYEAATSAEDDSDYVGVGACSLCRTGGSHCFRLGLGDALMETCSQCSFVRGLLIADKQDASCPQCNAVIPFPEQVASKKQPKVCYACLRAGRAALTKDTEFGLVSWEQAASGVTNGTPGDLGDQFERVAIDAANDWYGVRLPKPMMFELLRTPNYGTWQGECWLFCCRQTMTFVGEWRQEEFESRAADGNGERLFKEVVDDAAGEAWNSVGYALAVYVFECKQCKRLRAHYDSD